MVKKKGVNAKPLTGEALLARVKELDDLSREEKAKACGYVSSGKEGAERINMIQFMNALVAAEGIDLDGKIDKNGHGRLGRNASYRIAVQSNGNLLIGAAYTKRMSLKPGDEFEISIGRRHIQLKQVNTSTEGETV
jgi:hypothetical protein